jgi:hypothetical protein
MYRKDAFEALGGFDRQYLHGDTELAFRMLNRYDFGFSHCAFTRTGVRASQAMNRSRLSGRYLQELLDFGFRRLHQYASVKLTQKEYDGLAEYYARKVNQFLARKAVRFDREQARLLLENCPQEVRNGLGGALRRSPASVAKALFSEFRAMMRLRPS